MTSVLFTMLHGFLGVPEFWDPVRQWLTPEFPDANFHTPPLPGHTPMTEPSPDAFPESFDEAIAQYARQIPRESFLCGVGYSMGARLTLGTALAYPSLFDCLVLISVHPGMQSPGDRATRQHWEQQIIQMATKDGMASLVAFFEALAIFQTQTNLPERIVQRQRYQRMNHHPGHIAAALPILGLGHTPAMSESLQSLNRPILFITGEVDEKYTAIAGELSGRCRCASHRIISGVGHNTILENPGETAAAIAAFVRNQIYGNPIQD
jgi:2-succinyl-6-hydroxy-2,4-cyclohexadiene-1-carboxylate synthase